MDLTTLAALGLMLAETGARGRDGTALLRRLLAVRAADDVPPASELEALVHEPELFTSAVRTALRVAA